MAIDTAKKRASALNVGGQPWNPPTNITPDGLLTAGDRQQAVWGYRGILVGSEGGAASASKLPLVGVGQ